MALRHAAFPLHFENRLSSAAADGMSPLRMDGGASSVLARRSSGRCAARAAVRSSDRSFRVLPLARAGTLRGGVPGSALLSVAAAAGAGAGELARAAGAPLAEARPFLPAGKARHSTACSAAIPSLSGMLQPSASI